METIFRADGPEYVVTPDDVGAVIRVCCVPVDMSGLKVATPNSLILTATGVAH